MIYAKQQTCILPKPKRERPFSNLWLFHIAVHACFRWMLCRGLSLARWAWVYCGSVKGGV